MKRLLFFMLLLLLLLGCASKYTIPSSAYPDYAGEVNQHYRLIKAENQRVFHILTHEQSFKNVCPKGIICLAEPIPRCNWLPNHEWLSDKLIRDRYILDSNRIEKTLTGISVCGTCARYPRAEPESQGREAGCHKFAKGRWNQP